MNSDIRKKFNELMGIKKEEPVQLDKKPEDKEEDLDKEEATEEKEDKDEEAGDEEEPKVEDATKPKEDGIDLDSIAGVLLGGKDD